MVNKGRNYLEYLRQRATEWREFLSSDIWQIGEPGEEVPNSFLIKQVRASILLVRGIVDEDDAYEMVRALAYDLAKEAYNL